MNAAMKKICFMALCICTILHTAPVMAEVQLDQSIEEIDKQTTADTYVDGVYQYCVKDEKAAIIKYLDESSKEITVTVPEKLGGYPVMEIGRGAFAGSYMERLILPDTLEILDDSAFHGVIKLREVEIPANVSQIGDCIFPYYTLTKLTVNKANPYYMSENNIVYTKDKTELICCAQAGLSGGYAIPDGVTVIRAGAFYNAMGVTNIVIPDSVKTIGDGAFLHTSIRNLVIPASVENLGDMSFMCCHELKNVYYLGDVPQTEREVSSPMAYGFTTNYTQEAAGWDQMEWGSHEHKIIDRFYDKGDVNGDNTVDLKDAQIVLKHALKIEVLTEDMPVIASDVNRDAKVDLQDAQKVLKMALKIVSI